MKSMTKWAEPGYEDCVKFGIYCVLNTEFTVYSKATCMFFKSIILVA